jgi:hypothetical protein
MGRVPAGGLPVLLRAGQGQTCLMAALARGRRL